MIQKKEEKKERMKSDDSRSISNILHTAGIVKQGFFQFRPRINRLFLYSGVFAIAISTIQMCV